MKKKIIVLLYLSSLLFISGCSLFSQPKKIAVKIPQKFKYSLAARGFKTKRDWWKKFKSPELNSFIAQAIKNNLNYLIAIKNIQIAKTYVSENESDLFPAVNLNLSTSRNKIPGYQTSMFSGGSSPSTIIYNLNQAGLNASYELDVWHQINNAVNQAKANVAVSRENADVIKLMLISNVAQSYFQIDALNSGIENLRQQYLAEKEIYRLNSVKYKEGLIDIGPVVNAKILMEIIETQLNDSIKLKDITQNTLAYYLGEYPETLQIKGKKYKSGNFNDIYGIDYAGLIPPNIPSLILTRRPDVKEALYNVLSYAYAKKESLANFFPVFSLTGSYGYASPGLVNFISDTNSLWNFGLNILAPVFNYKKNISIYKRSKLQYKQAVLNYRNTVINAFSETDNALAGYKNDFRTLKSYKKNYIYALKLFRIYRVQYRAGIADKITYLTYKSNLLSAEYNLINQNMIIREDIINIYNALGMGLKQKA